MFKLLTSKILAAVIVSSLAFSSASYAFNKDKSHGEKHGEKHEHHKKDRKQTKKTMKIATKFLTAIGSGDIETVKELMSDDFVWQNEGNKDIPWIGSWEGKEKVLNEFLPAFSKGFKTEEWSTDYKFAKNHNAVFMGTMSGVLTNTGKKTGKMNWAALVTVNDDKKVTKWVWLENSYAVSEAFKGE